MGVSLEDESANGTYLRVRNQTTLRGGMFRIGDQLFVSRGALMQSRCSLERARLRAREQRGPLRLR